MRRVGRAVAGAITAKKGELRQEGRSETSETSGELPSDPNSIDSEQLADAEPAPERPERRSLEERIGGRSSLELERRSLEDCGGLPAARSMEDPPGHRKVAAKTEVKKKGPSPKAWDAPDLPARPGAEKQGSSKRIPAPVKGDHNILSDSVSMSDAASVRTASWLPPYNPAGGKHSRSTPSPPTSRRKGTPSPTQAPNHQPKRSGSASPRAQVPRNAHRSRRMSLAEQVLRLSIATA
jgi:hypothetical protein